MLFQATKFVVICYSSHRKLIHFVIKYEMTRAFSKLESLMPITCNFFLCESIFDDLKEGNTSNITSKHLLFIL